MSSTDVLTAFADWQSATAELGKHLKDSLWQLSDTEIAELLRGQHATIAQAQSQVLTVIGDADGRGLAGAAGASSTRAYLTGLLRMSPQLASEQVRVATALRLRYTDTGDDLAEGKISYEQAKAIAFVGDHLPSKACVEDKAWAQEFLLGEARKLDAYDLRKLGKRIDSAIDPDGVLDREKAAAERRACNIRDNHDGTQTMTVRETDENMALIKAAMTSLDGPKPAADGTRDERAPEVRRADAVMEIIRQVLRGGTLPSSRGERPHLFITASVGTLRTGHGFGRTASGEDISGDAIQRIACDEDLFGILLNDQGVPLNVGRRYRSVTPAIWIALVARDTGCQWAGCTAPAAYCEAHHLTQWIEGSETSLEDTGLYCSHHHTVIHAQGWVTELGPDGRPQLRPPAWIDPERTPIRNTYWQRQEELRLDLNRDREPDGEPDGDTRL